LAKKLKKKILAQSGGFNFDLTTYL